MGENSASPVNRAEISQGYRYRVTLLGDVSTGKTSCASLFMRRERPKHQESTVAVDYMVANLETNKKEAVKLMLWDTPGDSRTRNAACGHCRRMSAVLFFFDVTVRESFLHTGRWHDDVKDQLDPQTLKYLIATKIDLVDGVSVKRVTMEAEARELAASLGMRYFELNATDIADVDRVMSSVFDEVHSKSKQAVGSIVWDRQADKKNMNKTRAVAVVSPTGKCGGCWPCRRKAA